MAGSQLSQTTVCSSSSNAVPLPPPSAPQEVRMGLRSPPGDWISYLPLSLIFCAHSLSLCLSLCGRWRFISESTRSRLKQMLITTASPLSLLLYSFSFGKEAVDSLFLLRALFFSTPHEHINEISWPSGRRVFALISIISTFDCKM